MKARTIVHEKVKYIAIDDLISYLDETALESEKVKNNYAVELLNKLADTLSKANEKA